jgi:tRNA(Arg) A34 adenosine deaminase TadA
MISVVADEVIAAEQLSHERWMDEAIRAAREAESAGEVPVGACIVRRGDAPGGRGKPHAH